MNRRRTWLVPATLLALTGCGTTVVREPAAPVTAVVREPAPVAGSAPYVVNGTYVYVNAARVTQQVDVHVEAPPRPAPSRRPSFHPLYPWSGGRASIDGRPRPAPTRGPERPHRSHPVAVGVVTPAPDRGFQFDHRYPPAVAFGRTEVPARTPPPVGVRPPNRGFELRTPPRDLTLKKRRAL